MTTTTFETRNPGWGFFGTIEAAGLDARSAWNAVSAAIAEAIDDHDGYAAEGIRDFLDSRHGRHFADTVVDLVESGQPLEDALTAAAAQWQAWRIDRRTSRSEGIPAGLPYLTGWVHHFAILAEEAAAH